MKADARAPATTSPKIASGILNAARYASRSGVSPKCAPMTDSRSQPSTRLATRVTIMIAEARAIDIGNPQILRHQVLFAPNAGKETQALGAEAHPPDRAAHVDADDRPLRGAYRGARGTRSDQQGGRGGLRGDLGRGKCARQSREARFGPQEQRATAPQQDRESRDEGEEEDLSALRGQPQLAVDLVQVLLPMDGARQVERRPARRTDLREHLIAERLHLAIRLFGQPERKLRRIARPKR